jgi:hypothetical protein
MTPNDLLRYQAAMDRIKRVGFTVRAVQPHSALPVATWFVANREGETVASATTVDALESVTLALTYVLDRPEKLGLNAGVAGKASAAEEELGNLLRAKRHDRSLFPDDAAFIDWALSRARHALGVPHV